MSLHRFNTFEKLKVEVNCCGIRSAYDYRTEIWIQAGRGCELFWPLEPGLIYSDEWKGWNDFLLCTN